MKYLQFIFLILSVHTTKSQTVDLVNTKKQYQDLVKKNPEQQLVDVRSIRKEIILDLKYNSKNNFTKTNLYKDATSTYLLQPAAVAFKKVCDSLAKIRLFVKIWDSYRPYTATKLMWDLIKDERYVANPKSGSNHNRGLAIDLTLVDTKGIELDMGTGFDNFTDTAHHTFKALSPKVIENRTILKGVMEYFGFKSFESEWWHYSFATKEKMVVFDLGFKLLRKIIK